MLIKLLTSEDLQTDSSMYQNFVKTTIRRQEKVALILVSLLTLPLNVFITPINTKLISAPILERKGTPAKKENSALLLTMII